MNEFMQALSIIGRSALYPLELLGNNVSSSSFVTVYGIVFMAIAYAVGFAQGRGQK